MYLCSCFNVRDVVRARDHNTHRDTDTDTQTQTHKEAQRSAPLQLSPKQDNTELKTDTDIDSDTDTHKEEQRSALLQLSPKQDKTEPCDSPQNKITLN